MEAESFSLESPNGLLLGKKMEIPGAPLVLLLHGHNGFYHFAFFPVLQETLGQNGISSVAFNYSHNGISGDGDYFDELDKYEANCRQLEVEDSLFIVENIPKIVHSKPKHLFLFGHSMGGFTAGFVAAELLNAGVQIAGLIFLNALQRLNVRSAETMEEWIRNGIYYRKNGRTNQELPQGKNFLLETLDAEGKWDLNRRLTEMDIPVLVVHGDADESVPFSHGEVLFETVSGNNEHNSFFKITGGTHTLNTRHTGNRDSKELQEFLSGLISWIKEIG